MADRKSSGSALGKSLLSQKKRKTWFQRLFRERELLLRSEDRVRHIRLTTAFQAGSAAIALIGLTWATGATVASLYQDNLLDQRRVEIAEAKLAYDSVLGELGAYQKQLKTISNEISERLVNGQLVAADSSDLTEEMTAFVDIGRALTRTLNQAYIDLDVPPDERHRLIASRDVLHDKIKELEATLADAHDSIRSLERDARRKDVSLSDARQENEDLILLRTQLESRVDSLKDSISRSRNNSVRLISEVETLNAQLTQSQGSTQKLERDKALLTVELAATRDRLDQLNRDQVEIERRIAAVNERLQKVAPTAQLADLSDETGEFRGMAQLALLETGSASVITKLEKSRDAAVKANRALDTVLDGLSRVAGHEPTSHDRTGAGEPERALALLGEIESLHDTQMALVEQLTDDTSANIAQSEKVIASTGLDVERMLALTGFASGQGGPLEQEGGSITGSSADLAMNVGHLENKVQRWQALRKVLGCTPLVSPVDYYHLTSKFGKRKDPFTGKRAMHKGVDMGGWPGTKVFSTAPGKVTKAGNSNQYGRMVEIDHGCGIITRYGHLKKVLVKRGQEIGHRAVIGKLGSTGRSTGPHVHYEIRVDGKPVDPVLFIEAGRHVYKG
ncbi:M23 family metallopeptidase [Aestuariispira insulae]|uniref:Peptidase M23-like protein n=1 Tax=Aestuariispira insulae TaxID=1461337 RepID=A0A3D9HVQ0_9PROT|nr:M23 family metallopeptidase [Aestuariispira insulae]RED53461.1 peptidase M23-like protein [Aestuariispira insulae]